MKHIRIISPSGTIDPSYIDGASARLRAWGYEVSEGVHARDVWGRFAGRDEDRLSDLMEALDDKQVDMILCSRGGYGLQRIISGVREIEKPIIGFSDITALHMRSALYEQYSLHSIMCKHIATLDEDSEELIAFRQALAQAPITYEIDAHPLNRPGKAHGKIIGGNLSVLYGLQGTEYSLEFLTGYEPTILMIEDIGERHYHIDRMMQNLKMSGVLSDLDGLIVGQFSDCEDDPSMNETVYETIRRAVDEYDYPILFNAPFGHVTHNMPLWLGAHYKIDIRPSTKARIVSCDLA